MKYQRNKTYEELHDTEERTSFCAYTLQRKYPNPQKCTQLLQIYKIKYRRYKVGKKNNVSNLEETLRIDRFDRFDRSSVIIIL